MPSAISPATTRIPAWQRLGLKLKSAQIAEEPNKSPVEADLLKRKQINSIDQPQSKKVKKSSTNPVLPTSTEEALTPNLAKKKSVTFTPETKVEDGDSIKQLFSAWVAEQKLQDPSFQPKSSQVFDTPEHPKVEEQIDTALSEKERRVKRVRKLGEKADQRNQPKDTTKQRKPKSQKQSKVSKLTKAPTRPFLAYLQQYHESRDTWKFNKNHQIHLLKHIFNVEVIPSDHAHLIYEYIAGLQGSVRTRLRDEAFEIKVKDQEDGAAGFPESMADRDKRQREYDFVMKEYIATMTATNVPKKMGYEEGVLMGLSDVAMASRVAKRMRAEQILAELEAGTYGEGNEEASAKPRSKVTYSQEHQEDIGETDSQKRLRMNNGSSQKVVRKRKQRTTAADDDMSSSDESSDSESSSDDDPETPPGRHAGIETSSSSSSSSSSSESDDEDDDDEDDEEDESEDSDSE
jgi:hypothetical protein